MKVRCWPALLGLCLCFSLAACGGTIAPAPTAAPEPTAAPPTAAPTAAPAPTAMPTDMAMAPTAAPAANYPVTIQNCGRTLTFSKAPERIVTTYPNAAELLIRLGVGDKIVGSMYHKDTPVTAEVAEAFNRIPKQFDKYPAKEELVALKADFALATYDSFDFSGQNGMPSIDEAASFGLPVYGISTECGGGVKTSATLSMIYDDILNLGKIFDAQAKAQQIVAELKGRVDAVQKAVAGQAPLKATIYYGGEGPLGVFTNGIYADLLKLAGGETVFPNEKQNSAEMSVEAFAAANPDVIFVLEYGTPFDKMREYLRKTFPNISAVKSNRIVLVDSGTFPPGYRNIEAVEAFAKGLHPEAFASASTTTYPVTIENCGRTLTFDKAPSRVVSLWQPPNELLLALGLQGNIAALAGNYTDLRPDLAPLAAKIKIIGTSMQWPSKEVLLNEKPDLVIAEGLEGFMYDASKGYATVAEIEATGAKVLSTGGSCTPTDPNTQKKSTQTVYNDLETLGTIFGVRERADALIEQMQQREAAIVAKVAGKPPIKVAFYNGGEGPVFVLSFGIWEDLMTKAGGKDVISTTSFQVSNEEFAAGQPDVILIGFFPGQDPKDSIAFLKKTFPNIPAVKNDRLVPIATIDTEASVRVIDGLEQIAKALHPEAFK